MKQRENRTHTLLPLDWQTLAQAAIDNAGATTNDEKTLGYLMRCAQRLRQGRAKGYFLRARDQDNPAEHFLWIDNYQGFHLSELNLDLESPDPSAAMIFDCWTPASKRGKGSYAIAISLAAAALQAQQRQAWIFAAATNKPSVQGIAKAGFTYRFSVVRGRKFGKTTLSRRPATEKSSECLVPTAT